MRTKTCILSILTCLALPQRASPQASSAPGAPPPHPDAVTVEAAPEAPGPEGRKDGTKADGKEATTEKTASPRRPRISLLGDGYAQIVELKESATSVGLGVAIEATDVTGVEGSLFIKKGTASSISNDRRAFALSMLTPSTANVGLAALLRYYPTRRWCWTAENLCLGFAGFYSAGSVDWSLPDAEDPEQPPVTKNAMVYAAGVGPSVRYYPDWLTVNTVKMTFTPSMTIRGVAGDAGTDSAFRTRALGEGRKLFVGLQTDVELRINGVFANASFTTLTGHTPGLSRGQFVVSVGFRGGIDLGQEAAQ